MTAAAIDITLKEFTGEVASLHVLRGDFCRVRIAATREELVGEVDESERPNLTGMVYRFFGEWIQHPTFGWQFKFSGHLAASEQSPTGTMNYLARSGLGIDRRTAGQLVRKYGVSAIRILRETPAAVLADGFFADHPEAAHAAAAQLETMARLEKPRAELFTLFSGHGMPGKAVDGALRTWGARAPAVVRRDPFSLLVARIDGVGFSRADSLYTALGLPLHRLKRQMMAGWYGMLNDGDGNTWETIQTFAVAILDAIGFDGCRPEKAVELGLRSRWLRSRGEWIATAERASAEEAAAHYLHRLVKRSRPLWPTELPQGDLTEHQYEKAKAALCHPVVILAGSPGTGKTFLAAHVIRETLRTIPATRIAVCAPTGKAAVRISMAMERYGLPLRATTIHSLLKGSPESGFMQDEEHPLPHSVIVVDEASMIDVSLLASLLAAMPWNANLLLVGDPYQLAPVGHGAPLRDMLAAGVPSALLTEIKRNAGQIVEACREIKDGAPFTYSERAWSDQPGENLKLLDVKDAAAQAELLLKVIGKVSEKGIDPVWETQVVVPRNDDTPVSRLVLNPMLQALLNPRPDNVPDEMRNEKYRVGDKFICLRNQDAALFRVKAETPCAASHVDAYESARSMIRIANGDQGRVLAVSPVKVVVEFYNPTRVVQLADKITTSKDFDLAYAITGHKCVHPDTMVESKEGFLPIRMLSETGAVATLLGSAPYLNMVRNPKGPALKITTEHGYEITVTPEHRVESWDGNGYSMHYAADFQAGDWVRIKLGSSVEPDALAYLPPSPDVNVRSTVHAIPPVVSPEVAEFLGLMVADGTVFSKGFRLLKRHADVIERFRALCQSIFDANVRPASVGPTNGYEVSSAQIADWLRAVGGMMPNDKHVPECILRSPLGVQARFLRGLFEDGTVNLRDGGECDHIEWSTCYEGMARTVQTMLLRFGVISTRTKRRDGQHVIYIYGRSVVAFRELIGFVAKKKNERLTNCHISEKRHMLPVSEEQIESFKATHSIPYTTLQNARARGTVTRETARIAGWSHRLDYFEDKIASVENVECESMCIEVPDGHRFLQNGFPWWNSQGSEWPLVIIMGDPQASMVACREWIYTAISRASRMCLVIGDRATVFRWVLRRNLEKRKTFLRERIEELRAGPVTALADRISGPCTFCGSPDHWRPDCPEIAEAMKTEAGRERLARELSEPAPMPPDVAASVESMIEAAAAAGDLGTPMVLRNGVHYQPDPAGELATVRAELAQVREWAAQAAELIGRILGTPMPVVTVGQSKITEESMT